MSPVHYRCPHCRAQEGQRCTNFKGQPCSPHRDRTDLVRTGDDPTYQKQPTGGNVSTRTEQPSLFD